jgi:alpha-D-ribose 1-methylphosphonate 5-triphosphate synthase subunit PhnG
MPAIEGGTPPSLLQYLRNRSISSLIMDASEINESSRADGSQSLARQQWMRILARGGEALRNHEAVLRGKEHQFMRPAETGMVMVRARAGGDGAAFNIGEMTVTRCVVRLADGTTGYSYVAGRSKAHAELAALADACLQGPDSEHWIQRLIMPLQAMQDAAMARQATATAATRVDFVTLVRGES